MFSQAIFLSRDGVLMRGAFVVAVFAFTALPARAGLAEATAGFFSEKLESIQLALKGGQRELYATGYAWHLPWAYTKSTRARLNDATWGGGFGCWCTDKRGDRNSVYVIAFEDSHRSTQVVLGYAWQRYWVADRDWSLGWGYMAFLFSREDVAHRWPLPAALPCVSLRYRRWEVVSMYVPHVSKEVKGDVLYFFLRVAL